MYWYQLTETVRGQHILHIILSLLFGSPPPHFLHTFTANMEQLSSELLLHVAGFLDTKSKVCVESTCTRLRGILKTTEHTDVTAYIANVHAESFVTWISTCSRLKRVEVYWLAGEYPRKLLLALLKQHDTLESIQFHFLYGLGRNEQVVESLVSMCTKLKSFCCKTLGNTEKIEGKRCM